MQLGLFEWDLYFRETTSFAWRQKNEKTFAIASTISVQLKREIGAKIIETEQRPSDSGAAAASALLAATCCTFLGTFELGIEETTRDGTVSCCVCP